MRQLYIIDTKSADLILQEASLANTLVNFRGLLYIFYEMDLLLEYQNRELKCFRANRGLLLQETDEKFQLHALLVDALHKVRLYLNRIVVNQ